jgi:hypothetical protein
VGSKWRGGGGEKNIVSDLRRERQSLGQKWNWRGLEMAVSEKRHLSIFSKANQ